MRQILMLQPNDASTMTKYDAAGRVAATIFSTRGWGRDDGPLSEAYVYDAAGRKSIVIDSDGKMSKFDYDSSGRLSSASYPLTASIMETAFAERLDAGLFPEIVSSDEDGDGGSASSKGFHGGSDWSFLPDFDEAPALGEAIEKALAMRQGLYENWRGRGFRSGDHWRPGMRQGYSEFMKPLALSQSELSTARSALGSLDGWLRLDQYARVWTETYGYDERGNRTKKENAWGSITYQYDIENRLSIEGKRTYSYDDNGSLEEEALGSQTLSYRYDDEQRLIEAIATEPSLWGRSQNDKLTSVSYGYDALGRRSTRRESLGFAVGSRDEDAQALGASSSSREPGFERTLYDGFSLDSLAVFHDPGERGTRSWHDKHKTIVEYLWADGTLLSSTEYYKRESGRYRPVAGRGDRAYFQTDALGTVRAALDTRTNILETWRYDAFGAAYSGSFEDEYRFGYTGKAYDSVTGAYDYGFRDYAPTLGRFTTVDPIRDGTNWYAYCGSDPVNYVDLWGLLEIESVDMYDRTTIYDAAGGTYQKTYHDAETGSLRVETREPCKGGEVFEAYNQFVADHGSITIRAGGGGAGSLTQSASGTEIGGGTLIGAGASVTFDLTFTLPIQNISELSYSIGGSTNITAIVVTGADVTWNANGLSLTLSGGLGFGFPEGHFIVTDGINTSDSSVFQKESD